MKANQLTREDWILKWLRTAEAFSADVLNQAFHEAYHQKFPEYFRQEKLWGAQPVGQAMRDLRRMAKSHVLETVHVRLGERMAGFPTHVTSYVLPEVRR